MLPFSLLILPTKSPFSLSYVIRPYPLTTTSSSQLRFFHHYSLQLFLLPFINYPVPLNKKNQKNLENPSLLAQNSRFLSSFFVKSF